MGCIKSSRPIPPGIRKEREEVDVGEIVAFVVLVFTVLTIFCVAIGVPFSTPEVEQEEIIMEQTPLWR